MDCRAKVWDAWGLRLRPAIRGGFNLIADATEGGLYRSDDGGENWQRVSDDKRIWGRGWYFCEVSVDSERCGKRFMCRIPGCIVHAMAEKTFQRAQGRTGRVTTITNCGSIPNEPHRMIWETIRAAVVTRNGGETLEQLVQPADWQFYHVATDNRFPYWVYGAQQDSGAAATPSRSKYRSLNFHDWRR